MLDDQPFIVSRNKAIEKKLRKPSYENLISPNRFELLGCDKNKNENLDHREKYKPFNQIVFKVTQPSVLEKSSLNSNDGSIVKTLYNGNLNKNVTEQDWVELFGLRTKNYLRNTCHVKLILCSKTSNFCSRLCFCYWTRTCFERISQTKRNRVSGETFSYRKRKKQVLDTFINIIKANSSRCHSKIPKMNCFQ